MTSEWIDTSNDRMRLLVSNRTPELWTVSSSKRVYTDMDDQLTRHSDTNEYNNGVHYFRFTEASQETNLDGTWEGKGVQINMQNGEKADFVWEMINNSGKHYYPAIFIPPSSDITRKEAITTKDKARRKKRHPNKRGLELLNQGDVAFAAGDYTSARDLYKMAEDHYENEENEENRKNSSTYWLIVVVLIMVLIWVFTRYFRKPVPAQFA